MKFVPEIEIEEVKARESTSRKVTRLTNAPAIGTRVRATLGETVIVGKISDKTRFMLLQIEVDGTGYDGFRQVECWFKSGWEFETLDEKAEQHPALASVA